MRNSISRRGLLSLAAAGLASARPTELIIDTHLEVWTDDPRFPFHHPEHPELKRVPVQAPIENQVAQMRDFGLTYAVLINPRYFGWDNSYISYSLHKYPKLFVAHGLLDPLQPDPAARLRYWMREHGFQGMRFSPIYAPEATWLNAKHQYPLWREAERLGAVFNFYILPRQMPMLEDMAARFPGVKIVIDHLGKPDLKAADPWADFRKMFRLKRFPQVWVSASEPYEISLSKQYPYRDTYPFFKATYEEFGGRQLIWGTGYPRPRWELPMDKELEFVNEALDFYTAEDRELILGRNALRIWKFPKG
ncbi:MAG TPA: amidohydrolase family protein [Bryobacteraceae bacterium]|jgi:predicted TIM-barrel fold metal-dependent hydrolase|nr:amidohydrolase family protein [Bryobacteraceae bacterium]